MFHLASHRVSVWSFSPQTCSSPEPSSVISSSQSALGTDLQNFLELPVLCRLPERKEQHREASYNVLSSLLQMCFPLSQSMLILGLKHAHHVWGASYLWHKSSTPPKLGRKTLSQTLVIIYEQTRCLREEKIGGKTKFAHNTNTKPLAVKVSWFWKGL